eukprot:TRINITY_DN8210_c0_g1_i7.p1 TRINITY_DN8210_c0_g1~~TRINITY_DN8210_c0_g1_i7.p1  ORF type:complete len:146 (-),score=26.79 TRINITY_DN8210_c0_g1_i7:515-952(-)
MPNAVCVCNKVERAMWNRESYLQYRRSLDVVFSHSQFRKNGVVSNPHFATTDSLQGHVNAYFVPSALPLFSWGDDVQDDDEELELYEDECEALSHQVLALPKLSPLPKFTEREWLRYAGRVWEEIHASPSVIEYNLVLHKLRVYR